MQDTKLIHSSYNNELVLKVTPGHFSSDRFHVNYYIDMATLKMRYTEAKMVAEAMADKYVHRVNISSSRLLQGYESMMNMGTVTKPIDTIICMDGCEMIGALLAEELIKMGVKTSNKHETFYVITPEFDNTGQMVVRENIKKMIQGKNVLVVLATAMGGRTISKAIGTILAYGGHITGLSVIFSNIDEVDGYPVYGVFNKNDLPDFKLSDPNDCDDCHAGKKLDAVVNSYGYQEL
ncbi:MAG: phosphoribosyltransferase [Erysipelotrichaceae bacterium]|nr:phosphoribosyltransferase [Erysipelotrichaceae bacterium]